MASAAIGSSPRVRGKPFALQVEMAYRRIIPASAGQTRTAMTRARAHADHPRECGANLTRSHNSENWSGSSPRVRGKPRRCPQACARRRIIPASAGQTWWQAWRWTATPDHPRECGANAPVRQVNAGGRGSSPRVRGKRGFSRFPRRAVRIIPASAGQTSSPRWVSMIRSDHPRECGANTVRSTAASRSCGSSPRVRGKPRTGRSGTRMGRIIPASAGQTAAAATRCARATDHPRECGANCCCCPANHPPCGSSPRVRGKRPHLGQSHEMARIIPASAGQTGCEH